MTASPAMSRRKRIGLGALALFAALQLVPYGRDHANPPMGPEPDWDSPHTRELFMAACGDCHSHATRWPWYSHVAPASWLVMHDVMEGREHFNISDWPTGSGHADEAAEELAEGEMPPGVYTPLHPEARLNAADHAALLTGLRATFGGEHGQHGQHGQPEVADGAVATDQGGGDRAVCERAARCCVAYVEAAVARNPAVADAFNPETTCAGVRHAAASGSSGHEACQEALDGWREGLAERSPADATACD